MSFELFIQGEVDGTSNLPRKSDLLRLFDGHVVADEAPQFPVLRIKGNQPANASDVFYDQGEGDPVQSSIMVSRPMADPWLWDTLFSLLRDFDLYLYWPADPPTFVTARADVPAPDDFPYEFRRVDSGADIMRLVEES